MKLKDETCRDIFTLAAAGEPFSTISDTMGIDKKTIFRWRMRGEDDLREGRHTAHSRFAEGLAHARQVARATRGIRKAITTAFKSGVEVGERNAAKGVSCG